MGKPPITPKHPERICWGCEKLCPVNHLNCRETRVPHPVELFGEDWLEPQSPPAICQTPFPMLAENRSER
jgi:hypothetical protein